MQGGRTFQVKALPSGKLVYWSFSRKKVNQFIKNTIRDYGYSVQYADTIKPQSLDYSFSYSPNEYFISALIYCAFSLLLLFESKMDVLFPSLILLAGFYCIYQYCSSKSPYNKQINQDK